MKVCAIMQPTYLPWLGYFDLLDQADVFVLLDDVQFDKRSWQQRNRIKTPTGLTWLTVPTHVKGRSRQRIIDVEIVDTVAFPRDHLRSIELNYRRTAHYVELADAFADAMVAGAADRRLVELNCSMIAWIAERLGLAHELVRSSTLATQGRRSERLFSICHAVGATTYLAPPGSREYLEEDRGAFTEAGIDVLVHAYEHPVYPQAFPPFQPYASVIDALFNLGPEATAACLRSGRRPWSTIAMPE